MGSRFPALVGPGRAHFSEGGEPMDSHALVWIVAMTLVATKFLDCYSTWSRGAPEVEMNPVLRRVMRFTGFGMAVWGVFLVVCAIVALCGLWAIRSNEAIDRYIFVGLGFAVSFVQLAVARRNFSLHGRYRPPH